LENGADTNISGRRAKGFVASLQMAEFAERGKGT